MKIWLTRRKFLRSVADLHFDQNELWKFEFRASDAIFRGEFVVDVEYAVAICKGASATARQKHRHWTKEN